MVRRTHKIVFLLLMAFMPDFGPAISSPVNKIRADRNRKPNEVAFEISYKISFPGKTDELVLTVAVPGTIPGRQQVNDVRYSLKPDRLEQAGDNSYAQYQFTDNQEDITITITGRAELFRYDLFTALARGKRDAADVSPPTEYLQSEPEVEADSEIIRKIAAGLEGKNQLEIVKNIHAYVAHHLEYVFMEQTRGALWAAQNGKGDCDEFTALLVALCRAKGIPARWVIGYITDWENTPKHSWAEVYLTGYGWVPFDATYNYYADKNPLNLAPIYFYLHRQRADSHLNHNVYYYYHFRGDEPVLERSFTLKKPGSARSSQATFTAYERNFVVGDLPDPNTLEGRIALLRERLSGDPLDLTALQQLRELCDRQQLQEREALSALRQGLEAYLDGRSLAATRWLSKAASSYQVISLTDSFLSVPLSEIIEQCHRQSSQALCPVCGGTLQADCPACAGQGRVRCPVCRGRGQAKQLHDGQNANMRPCPTCGGRGQVERVSNQQVRLTTCPACKGRGMIRQRLPHEEARLTTCTTCNGRGTILCSSCEGRGTIRCKDCPDLNKEINQSEASRLAKEIKALLNVVVYLQAGGLDFYTAHDLKPIRLENSVFR